MYYYVDVNIVTPLASDTKVKVQLLIQLMTKETEETQ